VLLALVIFLAPVAPQLSTSNAPVTTKNQFTLPSIPSRSPFWDFIVAVENWLRNLDVNVYHAWHYATQPILLPVYASGITCVQGGTGCNDTNQSRATVGSGVVSLTVTMDMIPTAGNILIAGIVVFEGNGDGSGEIASISENNVTWNTSASVKENSFSNQYSEIWCAPTISSSANTSVVISLGPLNNTADGAIANIFEYSGVTCNVDKSKNTSSGTSTVSDTGTTVNTTISNELWIGNISAETGSSVAQSNPTHGFTLMDGANTVLVAGTSNLSDGYLEKIVSSTGTANSGTTIANGAVYVGVIATFKPPASASLSDTLNLQDILSHLIGKPLSEPLNLKDILTKAQPRSLTDILNLVDTVTQHEPNSAHTLADAFNIIDSVSYVYLSGSHSHFVPAAFAENLQLTELFSHTIGKPLSEAIQLADSLTRLRNVPVALSEVLNLVDSLTRLGPPAVPGGFTAVRNAGNPETAIDLSWATNASDNPAVINYTLQHSTDQSTWTTICTCTLTTFTDSGLTVAATYYYRIRAYNGNPLLGFSAYSGLISQSTQSGSSGAGGGGGNNPPATYTLVVLVQDLLGTPLSGASVSQGTSSLLSNASGLADFGSLTGGSYTINVSASGCTTTSQPISLNSNHPASSPFTINIPCGTQTTSATTTGAGTKLSPQSIDTTIEIILGFGLAGMAIALIFNERNKKKKKREQRQ